MKIALFVNTPAQVHFYKYIMKELEESGHLVSVLARNYGETLPLLKDLGIDHFVYADTADSKSRRIINLPGSILSAYRHLRGSKPDLVVDAGIYGAATSRALGRPCLVFSDSETTPLQFLIANPFVSVVVTPACFTRTLGRKHLRIDGYKELAYLHPKYFKPAPDTMSLLGLNDNENFVVLRFNAFDALHDVGVKGFTLEDKRQLVRILASKARVFISCEMDLPDDLNKYRLTIPPGRIHDVLYRAKLVVADTGTMVTEAACLGTAAVILHPRVGEYGNFKELENKYEMIYCYSDDGQGAIKKAANLLDDPDLKKNWAEKREYLLSDKIDVTKFMTWLIGSFPMSIEEIMRNPQSQEKFRN